MKQYFVFKNNPWNGIPEPPEKYLSDDVKKFIEDDIIIREFYSSHDSSGKYGPITKIVSGASNIFYVECKNLRRLKLEKLAGIISDKDRKLLTILKDVEFISQQEFEHRRNNLIGYSGTFGMGGSPHPISTWDGLSKYARKILKL